MSRRFVQITVSGKVQGVCFRHFTRLKANELGLRGWVMNLDNGDVRMCVSGPETAVAALVKWCHRGSPRSQVDHVSLEEIAPFEATDFRIRR